MRCEVQGCLVERRGRTLTGLYTDLCPVHDDKWLASPDPLDYADFLSREGENATEQKSLWGGRWW